MVRDILKQPRANKMPVEIVLTGKGCTCLMFLLFGAVYLVVFGLLAELTVERGNDSGELVEHAPINSINKGHWNPPGASSDHLHIFAQISDLHLSAFHDNERGTDLLEFCSKTLNIIKPEVVMLTGDITDAKLENYEGSMQILDEWKEYKQILTDSKILDKTVWLDTRGNHDAFDVPTLKSKENLFEDYSVQGREGQLSYHYRHTTGDGDVISFIAVDACLDPGPKRPFNFFGMLKESEIEKLKGFIKDSSEHSNVTIFFGHYPSSVISSHSLNVVRDLFKTSIAYLCGHLHTFAGLVPNMYAYQKEGYLELELGDWKHERIYRVIVMDHGLFSFVDVPSKEFPLVIITNPKNEQFLVSGKEPIGNIKRSSHVRILAFSDVTIEKVFVKIDGMSIGGAHHVEGALYVLPWDAGMYATGHHLIEVTAIDSMGKTTTRKQGFSMDGTQSGFSFIQRFILIMDHTFFFKAFFVFTYLLAVFPLIFFKLFKVQMMMVVRSKVSSYIIRFFQRWVRRFFLLSSHPKLFYPLLVYNIYIICGPWFVGYVLTNHIGACFLYGILVEGHLLLTSLTYLYGALQMIQFNIPLTLYLALALDRAIAKRGRTTDSSSSCIKSCSRKHKWFMRPLKHVYEHLLFFIIVSLQAYLVLSGFLKSYGFLAFFLCPLRTWAILLAIYLHCCVARDKSAPSSPVHGGTSRSDPLLAPALSRCDDNALDYEEDADSPNVETVQEMAPASDDAFHRHQNSKFNNVSNLDGHRKKYGGDNGVRETADESTNSSNSCIGEKRTNGYNSDERSNHAK